MQAYSWALWLADAAAWMQASMMAQVGETQYAEHHEAQIDITSELARLASAGILLVDKATLKAACLRTQLANVKHILEYVSNTVDLVDHPGADDLERRAGQALRQVDELVRQQNAQEAPPLPQAAMRDMKRLQRHLQDIVLLACSRGINQWILQSKGIPPQLLCRLEAAFGQVTLQDDDLWSRLGNSKFHVWTEGVRFGKRKQRHGRGGRKSRRIHSDASQDETSTEAGESVTGFSAAGSSSDLPAGAAAAPFPITPTSSWTEPMRITATSSWNEPMPIITTNNCGEPIHISWG